LEDKDKYDEERKNYSKWKSRIEGVSSSGRIGSVSSNDYGKGNYSNSVSSDNYVQKDYVTSKKEDKPKVVKKREISSSSEDSKEKKKKPSKIKKIKEESDDSDKVKDKKKVEKLGKQKIVEPSLKAPTKTNKTK